MSQDQLEREEEKKEIEIQAASEPTANSQEPKKWRAKLYELNSDGGWNDLGTGFCIIDTKK